MSGNIVETEVTVVEGQIEFAVSETGTPMHFEQVERLNKKANVDESEVINMAELAEGGRGLQIIRDCMDYVIYIPENGRNHLRMAKELTRAPGANNPQDS
jgi:anti-sigma regulatory factor (Ser/Thr protein kinase)